MDTLFAAAAALGLASACGLRVFIPLLAVSVGMKLGFVPAEHGLAFLGSTPALWLLKLAAITEIVGFYVPIVDHAMDVVATPLAAVAGSLVAATQLGHVEHGHPLAMWATAILGGGGAATLVQSTTVASRAASSLATLGLGNHTVATVENAGAVTLSILAVVLPIAGGVMLLAAGWMTYRWYARSRATRMRPAVAQAASAA